MLNAGSILTKDKLAEILSYCGYASQAVQKSPVWEVWKTQWDYEVQKQRIKNIPIACHLSNIPLSVFLVAAKDDAFQIYEQIHQNQWLILVCELRGNLIEQDLCDMIRIATSPINETDEIQITAVPCICLNLPMSYNHYKNIGFIGVDETEGRFGEVNIKQCKHCGRYWLHYFVEYEEFSESGRYFMGVITLEAAKTIKPETAIDYLDSLEWHLYGGSYFGGKGKSTGEVGPLY